MKKQCLMKGESMKKYACMAVAFVVCWLSFSAVFAQTADDMILMTEQYPPYNFEEDGQLQGFTVDMLVLMLERMNSTLTRDDIQLLPWANAYNKILEKPNTVLFGMSRTPARKKLFKWVGPVPSNKHVLIARKDAQIRIQTIDDVKQYRIGVIRDDVCEQLLVQDGIKKNALERVAKTIILIRMLNAGRIDLWAYGEYTAKWLIKEHGFTPDDYEIVHVLEETRAYYAFHKDTPDALIQTFQHALDELKEQPDDGGKSEYESIIEHYVK